VALPYIANAAARGRAGLPALDTALLRRVAAHECDLCFVIEDGAGTSRTRRGATSICLETHLAGTLIHIDDDTLLVDDGHVEARVRMLLPAGVDLSPLVGHAVGLRVAHVLGHARPTIDATFYDARGRLLLWARDGSLPDRDEGPGIEIADGAPPDERGRARLTARAQGVSAAASPGEVAELRCGLGVFALAPLRRDAQSSAFLLVRTA
jgi:hypothetical protein